MQPWFRWEGGRVPYFFDVGVSNADRKMMRHVMRTIEKKTCVQFVEISCKGCPSEPDSKIHFKILYSDCFSPLQVTIWTSTR